MSNKNIEKIKPINGNKEVDDFYEKKLNQIKTHIKNKDFEKASIILAEELEQPYIPNKYYDVFFGLKYEILTEQYNLKLENEFWKKTPEQLLLLIVTEKYFSYEYWDVFLKKVQSQELDFNEFIYGINELLSNKKFSNSDKIYVLESIHEYYDVKEEFKFYNNEIDQTFYINFNSDILVESKKQYEKVADLIYKKCFKDIFQYKQSLEMLNIIRFCYFPTFPFTDEQTLAEGIIEIIKNGISENLKDKIETETLDKKMILFPILKNYNV